MEHLKKYFLLYAITPLAILTISASYYRYMVLEDFIVSYEVDCNPQTSSCFIGCEDDECTEEYYYNLVTRRAPDINLLCGDDITDCKAAATCNTGETFCEVEYCDENIDMHECTQIETNTNL